MARDVQTLPLTFLVEEVRAMFLYQVLLIAGGLTTTLFAISAVCPVPRNKPITGC